MTTENRIVGPGYYPRRPTKDWMCLTPRVARPGYQWYGWTVYEEAQPAVGLVGFMFVLSKSSNDACEHYNHVGRDKQTTSAHLGKDFQEMAQALGYGRKVGVHWPDGSWEIYDNGNPTGARGKNSL